MRETFGKPSEELKLRREDRTERAAREREIPVIVETASKLFPHMKIVRPSHPIRA